VVYDRSISHLLNSVCPSKPLPQLSFRMPRPELPPPTAGEGSWHVPVHIPS